MRKDAKTKATAALPEIAGIDRYHGGNFSSESYAFEGYTAPRYYTSDRWIELDRNFQRKDGKPLRGYGLEIETQCNGIKSETVLAEALTKIALSPLPAGLFKLQHDGSLTSGCDSSAECITQPMTREFIRNHYADWKTVYNHYFPAFGISAGGAACGMHVNISVALFGQTEKTQAEAIRKLYYIVNSKYRLCCALFARDYSRTGYCSQMPAELDYCRTMDLCSVRGGHGVSFNLDHYRTGRVELRLVGGQKNYACFRNTMESVFFLVDAVKRLSWADIQDTAKLFRGCNQYVFDRLKSKCYDAGTISRAELDAIRPTVVEEDLI